MLYRLIGQAGKGGYTMHISEIMRGFREMHEQASVLKANQTKQVFRDMIDEGYCPSENFGDFVDQYIFRHNCIRDRAIEDVEDILYQIEEEGNNG
jgi:hypothetical protein